MDKWMERQMDGRAERLSNLDAMKHLNSCKHVVNLYEVILNDNKAVYTSRSRVRVGRGSDDKGLPKHLGRSSNAKTARNAEKVNGDGPTDGPTDRPTDRHSGL